MQIQNAMEEVFVIWNNKSYYVSMVVANRLQLGHIYYPETQQELWGILHEDATHRLLLAESQLNSLITN
jgi:hypothetical protein